MKSRKIVLFIVEGITDKISLENILNQLIEDNETRFLVVNGDITSEKTHNPSMISSHITKLIKEKVGREFSAKDFEKVVHLIDTDGAYIVEKDVVFSEEHKQPYYQDTCIKTANVEAIKERNQRKSAIINRLIKLNTIWSSIPYKIYFFSCNLEHVFHNEANLNDIEKNKFAEDFEQKYIDCPQKFIDFMSNSSFFLKEEYEKSWDFIKEHQNSLKRFSNFNLFFNYL